MILSIDTSTSRAGVALVAAEPSCAPRQTASRLARVTTHSEMLLVMIRDLLADEGMELADVDAIACTGGPGSFTGLRIGMATAKGLCLALERPLLLVSSLQALAMRGSPGATVVGCLDALKGEVFAGIFRGGFPPSPLAEEEVLPPSRLEARLAELLASGPVELVGDGPVRWPQLRLPGVVVRDLDPPDPGDIGRLAALRWQRGGSDPLATASPRYIRASEAEIMAAQRAAGDKPG